MPDIILCTINARYIHASLGLRYLYANMQNLQSITEIHEFTTDQRAEDIGEKLLLRKPKIIGFGVYIWNVDITTDIIRIIKSVAPETTIIIGGPEVSFEQHDQSLIQWADYTIQGQADLAFKDLCQEIYDGSADQKFITPIPFKLNEIESPYAHYSDDDIHNRVLYVEASRGCPFKCEFCLSSLDKTAVAFDIDNFLLDLKRLLDRGARQFKFVDRTFNLKISSSKKILNFFLEHIDNNLELHFELIPDRLPEDLKDLITQFPAGSLQFEIGIQSFNPNVQKIISRKQNHQATCDNISWIVQNSHAHIHADLIFGLPSETLDSCAAGFDLLYSLQPHEIQVGILKRLRGTPITRHTQPYQMQYMKTAPYRVLQTNTISFVDMQRLVRFSRYWDLVANSGRFPHTLPILLNTSPFTNFMLLSDWLYETTAQTHRISLPNLFVYLYEFLLINKANNTILEERLLADYSHNKLKGRPSFMTTKLIRSERQSTSFARQNRHQKPTKTTVADLEN
ncbi:MAG: DUF4080 domain-containing protein [Gammaproteobacteria bacterium]|nr:DUF4080 domain-containing protein [Gammaproteobacteria bacterium]